MIETANGSNLLGGNVAVAMGLVKRVDEVQDSQSRRSGVLLWFRSQKKTEDVRICVDLKRLNKEVKRERFVLPTVDDILPSCVFSLLDSESGFWQILLERDTAKLTTFITLMGRYFFKRLPFGISSAPEIFQREMSVLFRGQEGVDVYMDDSMRK